jgi:pyruvate dehydrogenase E2 component (dihydrolipoamide acetyltransferase)
MPALGADMEKGTLLEWYVKPGDEVHRGQIVAEVDTAKSAIEIEVFADGVIDEIVVPAGREVEVGTPLARIRTTHLAEQPPTPPAGPTQKAEGPPARIEGLAEPVGRQGSEPRRATPIVRELAEQLHVNLDAVSGSGLHGRILRADVLAAAGATVAPTPVRASRRVSASPLARRRAAAAGVDLATVHGTGPRGAVIAADVAAHLSPTPPPAPPGAAHPHAARRHPAPTRPPDGQAMREAIGALMARSKREIPHYYLATTIEMDAVTSWLATHNADLPAAERVLPVALLLKATALAAVAYPEFNGHLVDGRFHAAERVRLGVPVALRSGGLITPSIDGAEGLSVPELNVRLRDIATRAKAGRLRGSEIADPTLTVTSLGDQGVEAVFGVIFPPQVALVGFGSIVDRPWAVDGLLGVRPVVTATLSADHRVSDGHRGALFLHAIHTHLTQPEKL